MASIGPIGLDLLGNAALARAKVDAAAAERKVTDLEKSAQEQRGRVNLEQAKLDRINSNKTQAAGEQSSAQMRLGLMEASNNMRKSIDTTVERINSYASNGKKIPDAQETGAIIKVKA